MLLRVQDATERISQNFTSDQLDDLGFELEDITRLVKEFEKQATDINFQLMQENNGTITQDEVREVERLMHGDLRVITKEHK
jgi:glucose-6-phosphate-specific signal transduction histidine kinase